MLHYVADWLWINRQLCQVSCKTHSSDWIFVLSVAEVIRQFLFGKNWSLCQCQDLYCRIWRRKAYRDSLLRIELLQGVRLRGSLRNSGRCSRTCGSENDADRFSINAISKGVTLSVTAQFFYNYYIMPLTLT